MIFSIESYSACCRAVRIGVCSKDPEVDEKVIAHVDTKRTQPKPLRPSAQYGFRNSPLNQPEQTLHFG